jgi:lipopolysaccharide assembly protein A
MTGVIDGILPRSCRHAESDLAPTSIHQGPAMRSIYAAIFLALLVTIGVFAIQNGDVITVNFLAWNLSQSVAIVTVAVYILGMLSGWTVMNFARATFRGATARPRQ